MERPGRELSGLRIVCFSGFLLPQASFWRQSGRNVQRHPLVPCIERDSCAAVYFRSSFILEGTKLRGEFVQHRGAALGGLQIRDGAYLLEIAIGMRMTVVSERVALLIFESACNT